MESLGTLPEDAMVAIYWTRRDLLVSLAMRLPEFEGKDTLHLLDEELTPARVGVTNDDLDEIASRVSQALEEMSIAKGWDILDGALDYLLDSPSARLDASEHPNSPKSSPGLPS